MNRVMGKSEQSEEELDVQDKILQAMQTRKMHGNASYLAFTATPKNTTLEKFGVKQQDGSFEPFHLYSMKQAIEEGFILDVLSNYTTYKSYYEIRKSITDNPLFDMQGVLAVQALSRLNRAAPMWGKKTEDLFILDFFNPVDDIKTAFDPYYTATRLSEATDVNVLHELKDALDDEGVYEWHEVEQFAGLYFDNADAQQLSPIIDTAASRFNSELALSDLEKADFKIKAKQFVKIYGQMASIIPFEIAVWEKLFWLMNWRLISC